MKEVITWQEFDDMCFELANQIKASGKEYKFLIGIPRGGMVVAVRLSYILNIPLKNLATDEVLTSALVIDDIADSGTTLLKYHNLNDSATLHYNENSKVKPKYWVKLKTNKWIVYPWE
jgi:hypoxanthine phosphoribosyltransferase